MGVEMGLGGLILGPVLIASTHCLGLRFGGGVLLVQVERVFFCDSNDLFAKNCVLSFLLETIENCYLWHKLRRDLVLPWPEFLTWRAHPPLLIDHGYLICSLTDSHLTVQFVIQESI